MSVLSHLDTLHELCRVASLLCSDPSVASRLLLDPPSVKDMLYDREDEQGKTLLWFHRSTLMFKIQPPECLVQVSVSHATACWIPHDVD